MPQHDPTQTESNDGEPIDWAENPEWLRTMDAMHRLSATLPDDAWMVPAAQTIAQLIVEVEPEKHLTAEQLAVLYGVGALLVKEGRKEMSADLQTLVALGKVRKVKR